MNESVQRMGKILEGRPHPQDLADCVWSSMRPEQKAEVPGVVIAKSISGDVETYDEFFFTVFSILKVKGSTPFGRTTSWHYKKVAPGSYNVRFIGTARQIDRVAVELYFWCDEAASFPPPGSVRQVRTLFGKLMAVGEHPEYISPRPTMDERINGTTGKVIRSQAARPGVRDPEVLQQLVRSWRQDPRAAPRYIGITTSPFHDAMLWVDDGASLWGFLWRNEGGHWLLSDWYQSDPKLQGVPVGRVRLCTLAAQVPSLPAVGGAGTVICLPDLESSAGQSLTKFFRFRKLNNQAECFNYMAASITNDQRLLWWKHDQQPIESLDLQSVTTTQQTDDMVIVSYPVGDKVRQLLCRVLSNRVTIIRVTAVNAVTEPAKRSQKDTKTVEIPTEERVRLLVRKVLKAAQQDEGLRSYFVQPDAQSEVQLRQWAKNHGQIYASALSDNNGCPGGDGLWLTIYEGEGNSFRQATFSFDPKSYRIFHFHVNYAWGERVNGRVPERPFTRQEIDRNMKQQKTILFGKI